MTSQRKLVGRKRRLTDEQVQRVIDWKPRQSFKALCRELGISDRFGGMIRNGLYRYKGPSP